MTAARRGKRPNRYDAHTNTEGWGEGARQRKVLAAGEAQAENGEYSKRLGGKAKQSEAKPRRTMQTGGLVGMSGS